MYSLYDYGLYRYGLFEPEPENTDPVDRMCPLERIEVCETSVRNTKRKKSVLFTCPPISPNICRSQRCLYSYGLCSYGLLHSHGPYSHGLYLY